VSLTGLGGREMDLPIPDIHLTDLGKGSDGMTPAELVSQVIKEITTATVHEVTVAVSGLGKDAGSAAEGAVKKLSSGLGGLFK